MTGASLDSRSYAIAIVGMAGRFPGARNIAQFWQNLSHGVESLTALTDEELLRAGVDPLSLRDPAYVKTAAVLEDFDRFDASFFGLSPRDAAIMDPQHRVFLECVWEALEHAGWNPDRFPGSIGVYAGSGMNSYFMFNLLANPELMRNAGLFLLKQTGNDKDVLATRVSYQLNLTGPSMTIQTACSTSLVAVHVACRSLLGHECDMALAGGVTIEIPHRTGYLYREGEILSRDGHCRAFDADATGTVFSSGAGVVVLRRLEDALADGDCIHAVIRGTAINNDGCRKAGYLAPSVSGQAEVVAAALSAAQVDADSISYVETHGTGTRVGDPIEITALGRAFRQSTGKRGFCAVGSLKSNVGHLDAAAGVAGLIKTVLSLENKQIPPSLHFSRPNPLIDFANSPFYVNTRLSNWETNGEPRRAGVTSLGIGGTNAHVVLEEAPALPQPLASRRWQILTVSARTPAALARASANLADHLEQHPDLALPDVAFTCHLGRKDFHYRHAVVSESREAAVGALRRCAEPAAASKGDYRRIVFLFPGQGSQYVHMARGIYEAEPVFREHVDQCAELLAPHLGLDLRSVIYPGNENPAAGEEALRQTWITQPALFVIEYALAQLWMSWGIRPSAMIGHSLGEFVAATLAGVLSLEDALSAVAARGRLMQSLPGGAMLAVAMPEKDVRGMESDEISLASINAPDQCVLSGPVEAIESLQRRLSRDGVICRRLPALHAFHSAMMEPIVAAFRETMSGFHLQAPQIPYISNVTGTWIRPEEARDPDYWVRHMRQPVRFSEGLKELLDEPGSLALEVGPGRVLSGFVKQLAASRGGRVVSSLRTAGETADDMQSVSEALAQLWECSDAVNWAEFHVQEPRRRVPLPTYPFERERFWIDPPARPREGRDAPQTLSYYRPVWKPAELTDGAPPEAQEGGWLVFADSTGIGSKIAELVPTRDAVVTVVPGVRFARTGDRSFSLRPGHRADYDSLVTELLRSGKLPQRIVHLWSVIPGRENLLSGDLLEQSTNLSFYSLLFLAQAIGRLDVPGVIRLAVVSNQMQPVAGGVVRNPERAVLLGPCRVIPKEFANIRCCSIDLGSLEESERAARQIVAEVSSPMADLAVAYRDAGRFVQSIEPAEVQAAGERLPLRRNGVYVITGGLGAIGLTIAEYLAKKAQARLILLGRTAPSGSAAQRISALEEAGAVVLVLRADVTDPGDMKRMVTEARERFGHIDCVIHAAGILEDGLIQLKSKDSADRVLAPKVRGTLVLEQALEGQDAGLLVLCSSISSVTAPIGQVDYAAANAFLDAFAASRGAQPGRRTVAIDWAKWRGVGMGSQQELVNRTEHPLLGAPSVDTPEALVFPIALNPDRQWIMSEHRLRSGSSLFPGTGYIELVREALFRRFGPGTIHFENLEFLAPLGAEAGKTTRVAIRLLKQDRGFAFSAVLDPALSGHLEAPKIFATGRVRFERSGEARKVDLQALRERCRLGEKEFAGQNVTQAEHIEFGPRWRSLRRIYFGQAEAVSLTELPEPFSADLDTLRCHPALLDMATGSALFAIPDYPQTHDVYVPVSYRSFALYGALGRRCYCHIRPARSNTASGETASFDLTVINDDGVVVAEAAEFVFRRLPSTKILAAGIPDCCAGAAASGFPISLAPVEIEPEAALDALAAIAAGGAIDRVIVAPPGATFGEPRRAAAVSHSRTAAAKPYESAAPDGVETRLKELWREFTGVDPAGWNEDFFDLGGHSLVALRLLARVEKEFKATVSLHDFAQAATIGGLAKRIREARPGRPAAIIPLNNQGAGPAIYCLGPVGGDVYSLRFLAAALGPEQRFFGLQPPPDKRNASFASSVEAVAAYYVEELTAFQPEGAFVVGGSSVGATVALEIAQQLRAAGRTVDLLFAIDGAPYNTGAETPAWHPRFYWKYLRNLPLFIRGDLMKNFSARRLARRLVVKVRWLKKMLAATVRPGEDFDGAGIDSFLDTSQYSETHVQYMSALFHAFRRNYVPKPYAGRAVLYLAKIRPPIHLLELDLAWQSIASDLEIVQVPGTHIGLIKDPHVQVMAADLKRRMALLSDSSRPLPPAVSVGSRG